MEYDLFMSDPILEEELIDIADFFKVFADPTRLKILFLLNEG